MDGDGDPFSSSFSIGIDGTGPYDDDAVAGVSALTLATLSFPQTEQAIELVGMARLVDEPLF